MKDLYLNAIILLLLTRLNRCCGFSSVKRKLTVMSLSKLPSPEESAKALGHYMAKSHEDKLQALRKLESEKNAEIRAFKSNQPSQIDATLKDYMVKSHEEKLRALAELSDKKNAEIFQLRKEISELRNEKHLIAEYQEFISKYMLKAQEEKFLLMQQLKKKQKNVVKNEVAKNEVVKEKTEQSGVMKSFE